MPDLPKDMASALTVPDAASKEALQEDLCDLTVQERAMIGEHIGHMCQKVLEMKERSDDRPLVYAALRSTRLPDTVFMTVVGWEIDPQQAAADTVDVAMAACAHYGKSKGIWLLINQQGRSIRYSIGRVSDFQPNLEYLEAGREYFEEVQARRVEMLRRSDGRT